MKNKLKEKQGITLVALVITVIVLIILAGVTLSMVVGDNGIITKAKEAKQNMQNATAEEGELLQNMLNTMNEIESGIGGPVEPPTENIPTTESYVGYYADFEDSEGNRIPDGKPDGIIYADLAIGKSGQWGDSWGGYSYEAVTDGLKNYTVSKDDYTEGPFGPNKVITANGTGGTNDRFYVMALEDINPGTKYCWYDAAYGKLDKIVEPSTNDFGEGKENTTYVMTKWDSENGEGGWGPHDDNGTYDDMWGAIKDKINAGWFVPSKSEWAAFGGTLKIDKNNYEKYGLSTVSWSSSQRLSGYVYTPLFNYGISHAQCIR